MAEERDVNSANDGERLSQLTTRGVKSESPIRRLPQAPVTRRDALMALGVGFLAQNGISLVERQLNDSNGRPARAPVLSSPRQTKLALDIICRRDRQGRASRKQAAIAVNQEIRELNRNHKTLFRNQHLRAPSSLLAGCKVQQVGDFARFAKANGLSCADPTDVLRKVFEAESTSVAESRCKEYLRETYGIELEIDPDYFAPWIDKYTGASETPEHALKNAKDDIGLMLVSLAMIPNELLSVARLSSIHFQKSIEKDCSNGKSRPENIDACADTEVKGTTKTGGKLFFKRGVGLKYFAHEVTHLLDGAVFYDGAVFDSSILERDYHHSTANTQAVQKHQVASSYAASDCREDLAENGRVLFSGVDVSEFGDFHDRSLGGISETELKSGSMRLTHVAQMLDQADAFLRRINPRSNYMQFVADTRSPYFSIGEAAFGGRMTYAETLVKAERVNSLQTNDVGRPSMSQGL